MKRRKILMIIFVIIALAINVYIIVEAFTGVEKSADTSIGFTEALIKVIEDINPASHIGDDPKKVHDIVRKLVGHFLLFGLSGIFTTLTFMMLDEAMISRKLEVSLSSLMCGLTIALLSEIIQFFVPGRHGLFTDVLIDFSGYIFFFAIIYLIMYLITHKVKKEKQ